MEFEQLRERLRRRETKVLVLLDGTLVEQHKELHLKLAEALQNDQRNNRDPQAPIIAQQILDLEAEMEQARVPLYFTGISRGQFRELRMQFPPPEGSDDPWGEGFEAALVAACGTNPSFDLDQAEWLANELDEAEWRRIWHAILEACLGSEQDPKSLIASTIVQRNALREGTAAPAVSQ